ncbi:GNAT family N-acetyltransferase [Streptomyces sp. 8L]|uniref:GNAT family N-acetyltransferase n=1 Tax=Streptomyces sp. 8L TaxID=2877242 RepID=UPI001CD45493|nr:GNAT family N-acetyltransferase [Streptomyces sp. 8L]MCA1217359.1 GNAT family N-acetyltransferase [Streptomyces sp. 8L]
MEHDAGVAPAFTGPVLYAPSVYGEYGGLPSAPFAVKAEAIDRGRQLTRELSAEALVVSNLPPSQCAQWHTARPADAQVTLYWAHQALVGNGVRDFLGGTSAKHRSEFLRQYRRGSEAGLRLHIARGPQLRRYLSVFTQQARATSERRRPALYGEEMLERLLQVPGAVGLLALDRDGDLAGGFFAFRYGSGLYLWAAAIDQTRNSRLHTYGWLMHQSVVYAAETGARTIDAGRSNYLYKRRMGFRAEPLTSLVYLPRHNTRPISRLRAFNTALETQVHRAWGQTGARSAA